MIVKKLELTVYRGRNLKGMYIPLTGQRGVRIIIINHKMKKLC
jgi:hypothetical protein